METLLSLNFIEISKKLTISQVVAKDEASKFDPENVVVINPEENRDEESQMKEKMTER